MCFFPALFCAQEAVADLEDTKNHLYPHRGVYPKVHKFYLLSFIGVDLDYNQLYYIEERSFSPLGFLLQILRMKAVFQVAGLLTH